MISPRPGVNAPFDCACAGNGRQIASAAIVKNFMPDSPKVPGFNLAGFPPIVRDNAPPPACGGARAAPFLFSSSLKDGMERREAPGVCEGDDPGLDGLN